MKIKVEMTCEITSGINDFDLEIFMQNEMNILCKGSDKIKNIYVISANEEKQQKRTDIIEGEVCPICGFNGEMKIIGLTDEYAEIFCPQCKSKFKQNFN